MNTLRQNQKRLRSIGTVLKSCSAFSSEDRLFLADALLLIANGGNADEALGVKGKKGVAKGVDAQNCVNIKRVAMGWIAT